MIIDYRRDIDGLRAIAVCMVIAFHAFPTSLPAGFIGVDVFFVISGYLITGIILRDIRNKTFSLVEFFSRRTLRLFPSLITVLVSASVFGWLYLTADEFSSLGKHLAASSIFVANFSLWNDSGYFASPAASKPFLHMWSLAVEEQFYLIWPAVLLLAVRFDLKIRMLIITIFVLSFSFSLAYTWGGQAGAAYYSPLSRFWELMIGALVATSPISRQAITRGQLLPILGVAMLLSSSMLLNSRVPFPGWRGLFPTIGAAMIIVSQPMALINRILASRGLVAIGLISYPLYLWHWPLIAFANILDEGQTSITVRVVAVTLSFVLAFLTYYFIESGVQKCSRGSFRAPMLATLGSGMLAIGAFGFCAWWSSGFPTRKQVDRLIVNEGETGHTAYFKFIGSHFFPCEPHSVFEKANEYEGLKRCFQSKKVISPDVVAIGDSHAEDLLIGLAAQLPNKNVAVYEAGHLPRMSYESVATAVREVVRSNNIKIVLLTAAYSIHARLNLISGMAEVEKDLHAIIDLIERAGKKVILVEDRPDYIFKSEGCKYALRRAPWKSGVVCEISRSKYDMQQQDVLEMLTRLHREFPNTELLRSSDAFCDDVKCVMAKSGILLFRDSDHLTIDGSRRLGQTLMEQSVVLKALRG